MLTIKNWKNLSINEKKYCLLRPTLKDEVQENVLAIIQRVQSEGDQALFDLTQQFDGASIERLQVPKELIATARISTEAESAIKIAIETIKKYHGFLLPENERLSTAAGVTIQTIYRPIQRVGFYVPGGNKTPLISSLLMQAIPALVAGCPVKIFCTPPNAAGSIDPHLLVAARLCAIDTIYTVGGAQAIAAMAYGTASIGKVDKIFGPGNSYVTAAKTLVSSDPKGAAIDMPAGPSEVMITADRFANPDFVAADLLAQAEHGVDSQVILLCDKYALAQQVNEALERQMNVLPRVAIIKESLAQSQIIVCEDLEEQVCIINSYAPEHLIINRADAKTWISKINAAGTIFLGAWAAETLGDYVTGSNHVLPTNGFAKNHNGLGTLDFLTRFSVQSIDEEGIRSLGPAAIKLAHIEGLQAHANAVALRLNSLEM